jgi:hypothetical protein
MSDDLVTLGTFHNATEAQFAINRLKEAGVPAVMADDNLVAMDFLLGNAIGWIKVQVRGADLERAEAVLADLAEPVPEEEIPWDDVPEAEAEAEEERQDVERRIAAQRAAPAVEGAIPRGERLVTMAYRLAIFGVIFLPLNVVSLALVLIVSFRYADLSPAGNRRYVVALLVDLVMLGFCGTLSCSGLLSEVFLW